LLLHPESVADPHSDLISYYLGLKQALWDSLRAGRGIPFWQDHQLGGGPAFTNPQAQYALPLHFLFWLLPPARAFAATMWFTLLAGGLSGYVLAGELQLTGAPRLFSGVAALFSTKTILAVYAGWLAYLSTVALLPLIFSAALFAIRRPGPLAALWVALAGALCMQTGMAQLVYYAFFFVLALTAVQVAHRVRAGEGREALRGLRWAAAGSAVALGLAAHLLLPQIAELHLYTRGALRYDQFLAGHGNARQLVTLVWPEALGTPLDPAARGVELWEDTAHFGFAALALALLGAASSGRRRHAAALTACFLAALLFSFDSPALKFLFAVLPGMDRFRIPSRMLFLAALFGACLAGLGLERAISLVRGRRAAAALGALAVALSAAEGAVQARRYLRGDAAALDPHPEFARLLADDGGPHRTAPLGRSSINAGWAAPLGLHLVTGYDPLALSDYQRLLELLQTGAAPPVRHRGGWTDLAGIARPDVLDALAVRWVVAPAEARGLPPQFSLASTLRAQPEFVFYVGMRRRDLAVYRNAGELPWARFVDRVESAPDEDAAAALLQSASLRDTAVVIGERQVAQPPPPAAGESASLAAWSPGRLTVATRAAQERFLAVSEVWHPGWSAAIDGLPAPLLRVDLALLGLWVPAGSHRVELSFRPLFWKAAVGTSFAAAAAAVLLALMAFRQRAASE